MISQGNNQEVMLQFNQKQNNRKYWSNDEHKKLNSAVILHGSNWKIVAEYLPGRNASQCEQRWKRIKPKENERNYTQQNWEINQGEICQSLDQNIRKTPWTEDEDKWVLNYWYQMVCYVQKVARKTYFIHIPNNVRILEQETLKKSKIVKKTKKYRKFDQKKRNQEEYDCKGQLKCNQDEQEEEEQQIKKQQLLNYGFQQQFNYLTQFPFLTTQFQYIQYPQIYYPYQFISSEFYGVNKYKEMLSCQKEQMYQSTFSDMTKSRNNLSQLQGQSTLNLSKFKVKQIQLQEIVAKEEEIDNSKLQNNILDTSFPLQIRADIMEMIQKQNLQVQFKQQEDQERLD